MTERTNAEGLTFAEWDAAARLGEQAKVEAYVASRRPYRKPAYKKAAELLGAKKHRPYRLDPRLSVTRARRAWRAGEDPTDYAAAPRPLPRRRA